jgi:hypothetical protein
MNKTGLITMQARGPPSLGLVPSAPTFTASSRFFFYFDLFNKYSRNESGQKFFFSNLALLSRVSPSGVTYEEVTLDHLVRLTSTWTSDATSIRPVPLQFSLFKMSHAIFGYRKAVNDKKLRLG